MTGPIEYAKVMGQTDRQWKISNLYRGFFLQAARTTALIVPIFSLVDVARRKTTTMSTLTGSFLVTASAAGASYMVVWPLVSNVYDSPEFSLLHACTVVSYII